MSINLRWLKVSIAALIMIVAVFYLIQPLYAIDGPDVIIESMSLDPAIPDPGQPFTLTVVTRNQGNQSTGISSFLNYVYLDPVDRPPTQSTAYTWRYGAGPLAAGGSGSNLRSGLSFATAGCDHVIYAWADKTNTVAETIESNNVFSQTVCVGVTCQPDAFEPDNVCSAARWFTNTIGISQHHTLCPSGNIDDEDWIKFATVAGITYTVEAKNLDLFADPLIYLMDSCGSVAQFGTGPRIVWRSPTSGVAYVRVIPRQTPNGPLTDYDLAITADNSGVYDLYEPDNTCATARDLPTTGARQTHYFQTQGDQDWVKFPVSGGQSAILVVDQTGSGVSPQVSLYNSCEQTFGEPLTPTGQFSSGSGGMFYAQVINQNAGVYGPSAFYDLSLTITGCAADAWEPDDTAATAKLIPTTGITRTHTTCPAGDQDWSSFNAISGTTYVLETSNLGPDSDTELFLYAPNGTTQLAYNDDYAVGLLNSRIIWRAPSTGTYYAKIQQVKADIAGPQTRYDFSISEGACALDAFEADRGDNGPQAAAPITLNGLPQLHNFCPSGDQDWVQFAATHAGMTFTIQTSNLALGTDTILKLFAPDRTSQLAANDDVGAGGQSLITFTAPAAGVYYVQVVPFNTNQFGTNLSYQLSASSSPPPAPTPTPTPPPTPSPTPPPLTSTVGIRTLILVNRAQLEALYDPNAVSQLMDKLYQLASHPNVKGLVIQVESSPSVAAAYNQWTANAASWLNTDLANNVAGAVRNLALTYLATGPDIKYVVIVGNDQIIPFRRVKDYTTQTTVKELVYANQVTSNTTQWAALKDNLTLTDNYYADKVPTTRADWEHGEIYLPDYAIGRLIETPAEMSGFITAFLASGGTIANRGLVTGYDFVEDTASVIGSLLSADSLSADSSLVGMSWTGNDLQAKQLATPRSDIQSINGHANHAAEIAPDSSPLTAAAIASSTTDLSGALIFTVGCHSGFNDTGSLDLAQAFAQKKANYVANTGYGWGGGGTTYSEALMRNYAVELLKGTSSDVGDALRRAKLNYYNQLALFNSYDDKVLAEATLYGLPMTVITTGASFDGDPGFSSVTISSTLPSGSFGQLNSGHLSCGLAGSFGAYDVVTQTQSFFSQGTYYALDNIIHASAGEPVQPKYFADLSAASAGKLHGALFLGGIYSDVAHFDPVVVQPFNEYVTSTIAPTFTSPGWYPPVPISIHSQTTISGSKDMLVTLLGQFNGATSAERLFDQIAFDTYYSSDPDIEPPQFTYVDGILNESTNQGSIKVEVTDPSGVVRVLAAFTSADGVWHNQDLTYDLKTLKWSGTITATLLTRYFIQAVDGAGNVSLAHNKGCYYALLPPAPLIQGGAAYKIYLPIIFKPGG
jgi:hypothetical protein